MKNRDRRLSEKRQNLDSINNLHKMSPINGQGYDVVETAKFKPGKKITDISSSELSIDVELYNQMDQNNEGNEQSFAESDIMLMPERKKLQIQKRAEKEVVTPQAKKSSKLKLPPINFKELKKPQAK